MDNMYHTARQIAADSRRADAATVIAPATKITITEIAGLDLPFADVCKLVLAVQLALLLTSGLIVVPALVFFVVR